MVYVKKKSYRKLALNWRYSNKYFKLFSVNGTVENTYNL